MQFCLLIWLLCIAGVNSRRSESEDPSIQFLYSHITVIENETIIEIPVIRSGNLDAFLSISCITEPITAEVGLDFQERMTSKESVILFHPGEQIKNCVVPVVDDDLLEPQEVFLLKLNNVKSSNGIVSSIGPNRVVTVTIVYDEDNPTIQLDRSMYTVSRPTSKNHPATVVVSVLRKGDINQTSTVGISTQDGLAVAGLDYHPKRTVIVFQPGEIEHLFEVEILYIEDYPEWRKSFKVILLFDELVNATLGAMSMATVTILENRSLGSAVFPAAPIVVSLAYYDDVEIGMNLDPSPGYPLICVTSCDAKFPGYSAMAHLCNESGINVSHIRYSWETAQTAITNGTTVAFKKVTAANLFARTDMAVLDSIFFKYGYLVRCAVQPILRNQQFGVPIRSKPVFIDRTNDVSNINVSKMKENNSPIKNPCLENTFWSKVPGQRNGDCRFRKVEFCILPELVHYFGDCSDAQLVPHGNVKYIQRPFIRNVPYVCPKVVQQEDRIPIRFCSSDCTKILLEVLSDIKKGLFGKAKINWISYVHEANSILENKFDLALQKTGRLWRYDIYQTEFNIFLCSLIPVARMIQTSTCDSNTCSNPIKEVEITQILYPNDTDSECNIYSEIFSTEGGYCSERKINTKRNVRCKGIQTLSLPKFSSMQAVMLPFLTFKDATAAQIKDLPRSVQLYNTLCHTVALTSDLSTGFQSPSFIATLKYQGFHEKLHPNRLHIHIEVPHQDGMLPLISTSPLHNLQLLLMDPIYRKEHLCSNLILPNETEGILGDGFLKNFDFHLIEPPSAILSSFPYQFDPILRGHEAVLLYRHLNMKKCVWTFDAWYHMTELVDLCGGYILSDAQVQNPAKSYTTVHVPLYVSYVFTSSFAQWTSIEHHTEMEFSFTYNTVLWQTGLEVDRSFSAQFQILRILLGSSGQLIIHFKTKAKFRGMFVLQHPTLLSVHSQLIPPSHIVLTFNLTLLWTAKTYDGPTQRWTAISDYSLKDYTGKYILKLVPCTVSPNQVYVMTKDLSAAQSVCTAHRPERFEIPIAFQQTNRPVPVLYTLNTDFQLINNEQMFLSDPRSTEYSLSSTDYRGAFSRGQKVYGRVLWHPNQDLKSAYKLHIEKVYLCTGQDGYIPAYDPTGNDYGEGPQFGCIQPSSKLRHRIVILDRSIGYRSYTLNHQTAIINAAFAEDEPSYEILHKMAGVDGFVFEVDGLYTIDTGHQWYIQVLYTIGASEITNLRWRRSLSTHYTDYFVKELPKQNGTNMRLLRLNPSDTQVSNGTDEQLVPLVVIVTLTIILCLAFIIIVIFLKNYIKSDFCHNKTNVSKYSAERCLFQKQEESVKVLSIGGSQSFVVKVQKVPLACFNIPADATEV